MVVAMKFDKRFFFDRNVVKDLIGKKATKAMSKAGAFIQRRARSSMRRRKKSSAPGQPPSAHSKDSVASLKNIQFAFDNNRMSLLVGPLKLNGKGGAVVPGLHEHGGTNSVLLWRRHSQQIIADFRVGGKHKNARQRRREIKARQKNEWRVVSSRRARWINATHRGAPLYETKQATANYSPRPFMGPAMTAEAPKFPSLFGRSA